jgi:hypothetical protein
MSGSWQGCSCFKRKRSVKNQLTFIIIDYVVPPGLPSSLRSTGQSSRPGGEAQATKEKGQLKIN